MQTHFYPPLIIPRDGVHSSVNMSRPLRGKPHLPLIWDQCHMGWICCYESSCVANKRSSAVSANPRVLLRLIVGVPTTTQALRRCVSSNQVTGGAGGGGELHTCRPAGKRHPPLHHRLITLTVDRARERKPCLFLLPGRLKLCLAFLYPHRHLEHLVLSDTQQPS